MKRPQWPGWARSGRDCLSALDPVVTCWRSILPHCSLLPRAENSIPQASWQGRKTPDPVLHQPPRRHGEFDSSEISNGISQCTGCLHQPGHAAIRPDLGPCNHASRDERLPVGHEVDHVGLSLYWLASLNKRSSRSTAVGATRRSACRRRARGIQPVAFHHDTNVTSMSGQGDINLPRVRSGADIVHAGGCRAPLHRIRGACIGMHHPRRLQRQPGSFRAKQLQAARRRGRLSNLTRRTASFRLRTRIASMVPRFAVPDLQVRQGSGRTGRRPPSAKWRSTCFFFPVDGPQHEIVAGEAPFRAKRLADSPVERGGIGVPARDDQARRRLARPASHAIAPRPAPSPRRCRSPSPGVHAPHRPAARPRHRRAP